MNSQRARDRRRLRRKRHIRKSVAGTPGKPRLSVFRSNRHMYCQLIDDVAGRTLASASTATKEAVESLGGQPGGGSNREAATYVGGVIAERAKVAGITSVAFDRNGYKFHGRVKELAEAARKNGLKF